MECFSFGKYNGRSVDDVAKEDIGYLHWLVQQDWVEGRFPALYDCANDCINDILRGGK